MFSLARVGASLLSFSPSFTLNSNTTPPVQETTKAVVPEETLDDVIKQTNEKIKSITTQITETLTKIDGYKELYLAAQRVNDRTRMNELQRLMRGLFNTKYDLDKTLDGYMSHLRRLTNVQASTDKMKMAAVCVQATQTATKQLQTQLKQIEDMNPEESDIALYEMMEKIEEIEYTMDTTSSLSDASSSTDLDREFASYMAQQKPTTSTIPSTPPVQPTYSSPLYSVPSYLTSPTKPLFSEFNM